MSTQKMSTFQAARRVFEQNKDQSTGAVPTTSGVPEKKLTPFQQARLRFDQQGKIDEQVKKTNMWKGKVSVPTAAAVAVAAPVSAAKPSRTTTPAITTSKPAVVRTGSIRNNPFLKDGNTTSSFQKKTGGVPAEVVEETKPSLERVRSRVSEMKENFDKNRVTIVDSSKRNYTPDQHRDQAKQQNFSSAKQRFQQQCELEKRSTQQKQMEAETIKNAMPLAADKLQELNTSAPDVTAATETAVAEHVEQVVAEQPATPEPSPAAPEEEPIASFVEHEEDELFQPTKTYDSVPEHKQMTDANEISAY